MHLDDAERCKDDAALAMYLSWLGNARYFNGDCPGAHLAFDQAITTGTAPLRPQEHWPTRKQGGYLRYSTAGASTRRCGSSMRLAKQAMNATPIHIRY